VGATRTIHRGSRGRFAGASNGKAEVVRNGRFNAGSRPRVPSAPKATSTKRRLGTVAKGRIKRAAKKKVVRGLVAGGAVVAANAALGAATKRAARPGDKVDLTPGLRSAKNALGQSVLAPKHMSAANARRLGFTPR
jgi:hypothetical protein